MEFKGNDEPIAERTAEALAIGDDVQPTARMLLMPYGIIYQRVNFPIVRDENHPDGWQVDVNNPAMTFAVEMVMN